MKFIPPFLFAILLLLSSVAASAGTFDTPVTYSLATSKSAAQKKLDIGIEKAVEDMIFLTRPFARNRLKSTNSVYQKITLHVSGEKISIKYDSDAPIVQLNGKKSTWTSSEGESFKLTHTFKNNVLTQKFVAEDGVKLLTFVFSKDFTRMSLTVELRSPKLAAPLRYTLPYKRL